MNKIIKIDEAGSETAPIRAVVNAVDTIEFVAKSRQGVGVRELARALRMTSATAGRVLMSLQCCGILRQDEENGPYFLGTRILAIIAEYQHNLSFGEVARRHMQLIQDETDETVFLGVIDRGDVVIIDRIDSSQPLRMASELGIREPAYCTALGKAMLSSLPTSEAQNIINSMSLSSHTEKSITSISELKEQLSATKHRGWALDDEEHYQGVRCVAAAIFNGEGNVVAAISVSGPTIRLNDNRLAEIVELVKKTTTAISQELGYVQLSPLNKKLW